MNAQTQIGIPHEKRGGPPILSLLKANIREYAMYIALLVIFIVFGAATNGLFLSPRNLTDLINQTGYVAVLAVGMTIILIIKHIDLSVGYVAGFMGAVAAMLLSRGTHVLAVIPIILALGIVIGMYQGFLVAKVKVPAFVTTLAGMFIFRGCLSRVTTATGTIIVRDTVFRSFSNGFIPDWFHGNGIHILTLMIGVLGALAVAASQFRSRRNMRRYDFKVSSPSTFAGTLALSVALVIVVFWMLAHYKGLPWTAVIVGVVLLIYHFILSKTPLGRSVYAIGGNTEAAELSGVNVAKVTFLAFCSMSLLAALSGILYTSRMASATPTAGLGFEMDAIASSYIGGVSVSGGVGKVTNTLVGALVIISLTNGMNLMGVDISFQYMLKGAIFILAVAFDIISRRQA
ncbi:MAG: sugar ABC transporter permease [Oscillospiraceae bacterium]|jgi:putative multiple sugar transport system permease protein|nr:sugar ABC transporter permease [Oscillospiraceae bacterium]